MAQAEQSGFGRMDATAQSYDHPDESSSAGSPMPDTAETRRYSEKAGYGGMDGMERDRVSRTPGSK